MSFAGKRSGKPVIPPEVNGVLGHVFGVQSYQPQGVWTPRDQHDTASTIHSTFIREFF